ncbi:MAG: hypothetical protein ABIA04_06950 [Pseudomonadota bacterium]
MLFRIFTIILFCLLAMIISCGELIPIDIEITNLYPDTISLDGGSTESHVETEVSGLVTRVNNAGDTIPINNVEILVGMPQNGVNLVADNTYALQAFDKLDNSTRIALTGNYFTLTTDSEGIFKFALLVPLGGDYEAFCYFIAGRTTLTYTISVTTE